MKTEAMWQHYYLNIAQAVREGADCLKRKVGVIVVRDNRILVTGYNGTPSKFVNCTDGGCERCKTAEAGKGYDECLCVHGEQNAIITAARFGIPLEGSDMYTTLQPCFSCLRECVQLKVRGIYYSDMWMKPDNPTYESYQKLASYFQTIDRQFKQVF